MVAISTKQQKLFWLLACVVFACIGLAIYTNMTLLFALPFILVAFCYVLLDVTLLYFALIVSLPISINLLEFGGISLDFPDEPFLLFITALFPLLFANKNNWSVLKIILKHPIIRLLIVWMCWIALTVCTSTFPFLSIKYLLSKIWYVVPFVGMTILMVLQDVKNIQRIFLLYLLPLVLLVLFVTYQHSTLNFAFDLVTEASKPFFYNHVIYGSIVSLFFPLCIGALAMQKKYTIPWFGLLTCSLIFAIGLYFAYSRGAWAAVIFAAGIFIAVRLRIVQYCFILFFITLTAAAIFLQTDNKYLEFAPKLETGIMHDNLVDHLIATLKGKDVSSNERFYRWVAGARMSKQKPIFGYGPNTFYENYKPYTINVFRTYVSRNKERSTMHNYFLFMLVEQGFVGMMLYAVFIFLIFFKSQQLYHALQDDKLKKIVMTITCMLGAFFINNTLSELIENDKLGGCFLIGIGIIIGLDIKQNIQLRKII
jgi:O-antigen ligase